MANFRILKCLFFLDIPIDSLLNIGRNMDQMMGREKIFYKDSNLAVGVP